MREKSLERKRKKFEKICEGRTTKKESRQQNMHRTMKNSTDGEARYSNEDRVNRRGF